MNTLIIEFPEEMASVELYVLLLTVARCIRDDEFPTGAEQMDGSFRLETAHGPAFVSADTAE